MQIKQCLGFIFLHALFQALLHSAKPHLVKVVDPYFWTMLAALEQRVPSLTVPTMESVLTTVATQRMLVSGVKVGTVFIDVTGGRYLKG